MTQEKFDEISKELQELLDKHKVEVIIRSELTFKELDETNTVEA